MKKIFSILMVAFAMTAFVACSKDNNDNTDNNGGNGGGNNEPTLNVADNTVIYGGTIYHMNTEVNYMNEDLTFCWANSTETTGDGSPKMVFSEIHIYPDMWGEATDLSATCSVVFRFEGSDLSLSDVWNGEFCTGYIDGVEYENESPFTEGTFCVSGNNDGTPITVTLDGKLKNGKKLQMKLVSDSYTVNE